MSIAKLTTGIDQVLGFFTATKPRATASLMLVLGLSLTLCYAPALLGRADYFLFDHVLFFEPLTRYLKERIQSGQLPMWNPYSHCGMTEIGNPSPNALYPPYLIFVCLPYSQALSLIMLLHQLIAFLGCVLLASSFGWEIAAAAVCGVIFALSGYMFSLLCNFTLVTTAAWLPGVLLSFRQIRLCSNFCGWRLALAFTGSVFSLAMMILAGRPEIFVPACAMIFIAVLTDMILLVSKKRAVAKAMALQIAAAMAGVLITMPLLVPFLEWVGFSRRRAGLDLAESLIYSANWYDFFTIAFSQAAGNLQLISAKLLPGLDPHGGDTPYVPSSFVGSVAITLALWGFADRDWRWRGAIIAFAILVIIMISGNQSAISLWFFTNIRFLSLFRYPIKWIVFLVLAIAIAAARGFHAARGRRLSGTAQLCPVVIWSASTLLGLMLALLSIFGKTVWDPHDQRLWLQFSLGASVIVRSIIGLATCGVGRMMAAQRISLKLGSGIILSALFFDLIVTNACQAQQLAPAGFFEQDSSVATYLRTKVNLKSNERYLPLYRSPLFSSVLSGTPAEQTIAYEKYLRAMLLPNSNIDYHVLETSGYEAGATADFTYICLLAINRSLSFLPDSAAQETQPQDGTTDVPLYRLCQSTGTAFVASHMGKVARLLPKLDPRFFQLIVEDPKMNFRLYKTLNSVPRAYLCRYWLWRNDVRRAYYDIMNAHRSGYNPSFVTWLYRTYGVANATGAPGEAPINSSNLPPPAADDSSTPSPGHSLANSPEQSSSNSRMTSGTSATQGSSPNSGTIAVKSASTTSFTTQRDDLIDSSPVKFLADQPEHISLSYSVDQDCLLVLADHFYPGWLAKVDGADCPIFRANTEVRAVFVPKGSHTVSFDYRPASFVIGLYLAAAGLLIWLLLLALLSILSAAGSRKKQRLTTQC